MRSTVLSSLLVVFVEAQWGNMFGWQQQPPQPQAWNQRAPQTAWNQQPQQPWNQAWQQPIKPQPQQPQSNQLFPNLLQQIQSAFTLAPPPTIRSSPSTTTTTTTTAIPIELVPNPDLEQAPNGNWPLPDPASWPVGPDWNDIRNGWNGEFGWGGRNGHKPVIPLAKRAHDETHK